MGVWGPGNFDEDTAADHLSSITGRLRDEIEKAMAGPPVEIEPDEYWGVAVPCNVELLALLAEKKWVGVMVPDAATVLAWKTKFLSVWDANIDGLEPAPAHKKKRRAILVKTFDRLLKVAKRDGGVPKKHPSKKR